MRVALLGKGKTGGKVLELLLSKNIEHTVFDSKNTPTLEKLKNHDVVISFLTGEVFKNYLDLLVESKIPVVTGSTGIVFTADFEKQLVDKKLTWIYANNFSLGMNIVYQMILIMKEAGNIFSDYSFSMSEVHHTKKLDSPSGTALSWKKWVNHEMPIDSIREGDVIGIHELSLSTPTELIQLKHTALDRKIFAEGAMFAAEKIIEDKTIPVGLNQFQNIVEKVLLKK